MVFYDLLKKLKVTFLDIAIIFIDVDKLSNNTKILIIITNYVIKFKFEKN
jgi:hypothetical protein